MCRSRVRMIALSAVPLVGVALSNTAPAHGQDDRITDNRPPTSVAGDMVIVSCDGKRSAS